MHVHGCYDPARDALKLQTLLCAIVWSLRQPICPIMAHQTPMHGGVGLQVFARCAQVQDTTGLGNPGISSDVALTLHRQQGIYGK